MNTNMISPIQPNSNLMISPIRPSKRAYSSIDVNKPSLIPRFSPVNVKLATTEFDNEYRNDDETAIDETKVEEERDDDEAEEERRRREEAESEALARQLMEEEAMASYNQSTAFLQDNVDQYSEEDLAALRAIMTEEENATAEANAMDDSEMTYETLLQLGERIGDVKSERWAMKAKKEIAKLPSLKFCKETMAKGKDENDCGVKCLVCQFPYEESENVRKLPCGHYFHDECIDQWLSAKDFCPYCRTCIVITED